MLPPNEHESCIADRIRYYIETCGPQVSGWKYEPGTNIWFSSIPIPNERKQDLLNVALLFYKQIRGDDSFSNYGSYSPRTLAASIFYGSVVMTNTNTGMAEVGEAFNVASTTISKHFHRLKKIVDLNAEDIQTYLDKYGYK